MPLSSLHEGYRAMVFGASGGIGAELVAQLARDPRCALVYAGARSALPETEKVRSFQFDLGHEATFASIAARVQDEGGVDFVLVATGVLHADGLQPEKSMRALDADVLARSFALNAIGPSLIAKHFLPLLPRERKSIFAALSARVGSISDNRSGGWHAYRASKAALNQLVRTCAIELAMKNKQAVCVTLHPGTVETEMSRPFQSGVPKEKLFSAEQSAGYLLRVLDGLTPRDTGGFFAWDGQTIPF